HRAEIFVLLDQSASLGIADGRDGAADERRHPWTRAPLLSADGGLVRDHDSGKAPSVSAQQHALTIASAAPLLNSCCTSYTSIAGRSIAAAFTRSSPVSLSIVPRLIHGMARVRISSWYSHAPDDARA